MENQKKTRAKKEGKHNGAGYGDNKGFFRLVTNRLDGSNSRRYLFIGARWLNSSRYS